MSLIHTQLLDPLIVRLKCPASELTSYGRVDLDGYKSVEKDSVNYDNFVESQLGSGSVSGATLADSPVSTALTLDEFAGPCFSPVALLT